MSYSATNQKKFLDAAGLAYFSSKLNNYPTNDVIEAVINGVQDALDEKVDSVQYDATNKKITATVGGVTIDIISLSTIESEINVDAITNAQIDALFA